MVEVLAFCLMPNHVHLLVKQLKDDGITKYISKVGTGIGGYFNRKNQRKGHVFQDRFYPVRIENDTQLKVVVAYIHTNPLSLIFPKWKEIRINDINKAIDFLDNEYRWSSYSDCTGKENFPSVTDRELILGLLNRTEGHKDFIKNWIENKGKSRGPSSTHFLEKL